MNHPPAQNLRSRLWRAFITVVLSVASTVAIIFAVDYAIFRLRLAMNSNPYGSVVVKHYTAVLQKNGKTTFTFDPPQPWTCVNTLFPHAGLLPCWYLSRHPEQRTDI